MPRNLQILDIAAESPRLVDASRAQRSWWAIGPSLIIEVIHNNKSTTLSYARQPEDVIGRLEPPTLTEGEVLQSEGGFSRMHLRVCIGLL